MTSEKRKPKKTIKLSPSGMRVVSCKRCDWKWEVDRYTRGFVSAYCSHCEAELVPDVSEWTQRYLAQGVPLDKWRATKLEATTIEYMKRELPQPLWEEILPEMVWSFSQD
jgi:hypothetical protein